MFSAKPCRILLPLLCLGIIPIAAETGILERMEWVEVPAGSFRMGNPMPEIDEWDESPVHKVKITNSYLMSRSEVTVEQFQAFRPDWAPPDNANGYAVGVSWKEAVAFCGWLSEQTGETYRLPTEAEWEWAARQSTSARRKQEGLFFINILKGPREWCLDNYGPYPNHEVVDPVGGDNSFSKVIRGGGDSRSALLARVTNRSSYGANYSYFPHRVETRSVPLREKQQGGMEGLTGNWFGRLNYTRPRGVETLLDLNVEFNKVANNWAGRYHGYLLVDRAGEYTFRFESDYGGYLELNGVRIIDWTGGPGEKEASISLEAGRDPISVACHHNFGKRSYLRVSWKHESEPEWKPITREQLRHTPELAFEGEDLWRAALGSFQPIGFRVVKAPYPDSEPYASPVPFVRRAVVQADAFVSEGLQNEVPHYRRRYLLPIPPDNVPRQESRLAGFHPVIMDHNHSPTLAALPNGDILWIGYSSEREYEPETAMIATRLRYGSDTWDFPEVLFNFAESNEHAPCLFVDEATGKIYFFWGTPSMEDATPFQWVVSEDNGATWSEPQFPVFPEAPGPHSRQPISGPFIGADGTFYLPADGRRQDSVLWASKDGMQTWYDTGGRSAGRHTVYVELKDGRIMGIGGKNTDIDGYQPVVYSADGGKTWSDPEALPLPGLGSNQRPSLIRLKSGRLFYAGDFQHRTGRQPQGVSERGVVVALSEDEGETWITKKLYGTLPHEKDGDDGTLGYSSAVQGADGLIHITSSMTTPCLHFEINEAWILDPEIEATPIPQVLEDSGISIMGSWEEGNARFVINTVLTEERRYLLDYKKAFFYPNGHESYRAQYSGGKKVGEEIAFNPAGSVEWKRIHRDDGIQVLTRFNAWGGLVSETHWKGHLAHGPARTWDAQGNLISTIYFNEGRLVSTPPEECE